jgi:hypothetical protein
MSHAKHVGNDVVITVDAQDTITLLGIKLSSLNSSQTYLKFRDQSI